MIDKSYIIEDFISFNIYKNEENCIKAKDDFIRRLKTEWLKVETIEEAKEGIEFLQEIVLCNLANYKHLKGLYISKTEQCKGLEDRNEDHLKSIRLLVRENEKLKLLLNEDN